MKKKDLRGPRLFSFYTSRKLASQFKKLVLNTASAMQRFTTGK